MPNTIHPPPTAARLKKEILNRVLAKVDADGKGIATWQCVEIAAGERVVVHTTDQWTEKGCITLKQKYGRNELQVKFHYLFLLQIPTRKK